MTKVQQETVAQLLLDAASESAQYSNAHSKSLAQLAAKLYASPINEERLEEMPRHIGARPILVGPDDAQLRLDVLTRINGLARSYALQSGSNESAAKLACSLLTASIRLTEQLLILDLILRGKHPEDEELLNQIQRRLSTTNESLKILRSKRYGASQCMQLDALLKQCPFVYANI